MEDERKFKKRLIGVGILAVIAQILVYGLLALVVIKLVQAFL